MSRSLSLACLIFNCKSNLKDWCKCQCLMELVTLCYFFEVLTNINYNNKIKPVFFAGSLILEPLHHNSNVVTGGAKVKQFSVSGYGF
jgi:hypothetical protein